MPLSREGHPVGPGPDVGQPETAGRIGEAIVQTGEGRTKISVRSEADTDLFRDEVVELRAIEGNLFLVKRKQIEDTI